MGQTNSTSNVDQGQNAKEELRYQEFVKNYQFLRRIKDPRYGEISILQDKFTKELVALREIVSKSTKDFDKDMGSLRARYKISHPNIVKVLGYTSKSEDYLCASVHKILMIIEYLDNDLEKEISLKKNQNNYYKEEQLWYLAENVVKALALLQKNQISHEDLKPSSIFISKMGVYKVTQHNIAGNNIPAYHQRLSGIADARTYLSPELLENLQRYELRPKHNPWKSDVFSLGMALLHAATLNSCDRLYDWNSQTLDFEELGERLASLRPRYSENFQDFLQTMLEVGDDMRPDFIGLEKKLFANSDISNSGKPNPTSSQFPADSRRQEASQEVFEEVIEGAAVVERGQRQKPKVQVEESTDFLQGQGQIQRKTPNSRILDQEPRGRINERERERGIQQQQQQGGFDGQGISIRSPKVSEQQQDLRIRNSGFQEGLMRRGGQQHKVEKENEEVAPPVAVVNYNSRQQPAKIEASEFGGIGSSTQLTEAPQSVVLSNTHTNKDERTVVSSSLNDLQDQVKVRELERDNDRGKSLISNEVARIISEFRTKKGIQDSSMDLSSNLGRYDENRNPHQGLGSENYGKEKTNPSKSQNQENLGFGAFYQQSMKRDSGFGQRGDSLSYGGRTTNVYHQSELSQSNTYGNLDFGRATDKSQNFAYSMPKEKPLYEQQSGNFGLRENQNRLNTQQQGYDQSRSNLYGQTYSRDFERQSLNPGYGIREQPKAVNSSSLYQQQQQQQAPPAQIQIQVQTQEIFAPPTTISETYADGSVYEGQKKNNLRHGEGTFYYSDGGMYNGEWLNGSMEGYGTLFYASGAKAYEGEWREDKFHGRGTVYNEAPARLHGQYDYSNFDNVGDYWVKYEGEFSNDNKEGSGVLHLANGERFEGKFKDDMVNGRGLFYSATGRVIRGEWWQNKLV